MLSRQAVDRPPVIAPGGMMSFLTTEAIGANCIDGACAMTDSTIMAEAAIIARESLGFESLGVPFRLTVEAEALGATVSCGTRTSEPMILKSAVDSAREITSIKAPDPYSDKRMSQVLEAIRGLKIRFPETPIIANVSGPATLASSIVSEGEYMRLLVIKEALASDVTRLAVETAKTFASAMVESGADVIVVSDPTACGEIVGPQIFRKHFLPGLQEIFAGLRALHTKSILHICGNVSNILTLIPEAKPDAFSMDSMMDVATAREQLGGVAIMGNISTLLLAKGDAEAIAKAVERVLSRGVDIVAPSCGLDRRTPVRNLRVMCHIVKRWKRNGQVSETST